MLYKLRSKRHRYNKHKVSRRHIGGGTGATEVSEIESINSLMNTDVSDIESMKLLLTKLDKKNYSRIITSKQIGTLFEKIDNFKEINLDDYPHIKDNIDKYSKTQSTLRLSYFDSIFNSFPICKINTDLHNVLFGRDNEYILINEIRYTFAGGGSFGWVYIL